MIPGRENWWTDDPKLRMLFSVAGAAGIRGLSSYFFAPKLLLGADGLKMLQGALPALSRTKKALLRQKMILNHPELVPDLALLDPAFTVGLPRQLTAYTGLDALAHATGSVLSHWSNEYTVALGYQAIKLTRKYLPRAVADGRDYEARMKMAIAANMAGMSFGNAAPGLEHAMGHAFGKLFKIHHGAAVGLFTPYMIQYVSRYSERYLELAKELGISGENPAQILAGLVDFYVSFIRSVGGPATIAELGITREQLEENFDELLDLTMDDGCTLMSIRPLTRENYRRLYRCALTGERVDF